MKYELKNPGESWWTKGMIVDEINKKEYVIIKKED